MTQEQLDEWAFMESFFDDDEWYEKQLDLIEDQEQY